MNMNWSWVSEIQEDLRLAKTSELADFGAAAQPNLTPVMQPHQLIKFGHCPDGSWCHKYHQYEL